MQNINVLCFDSRSRTPDLSTLQDQFFLYHSISLKYFPEWIEGDKELRTSADEYDTVLFIVGKVSDFFGSFFVEFQKIVDECKSQNKPYFIFTNDRPSMTHSAMKNGKGFLMPDITDLAKKIREVVDTTIDRQVMAMYPDTWEAMDVCGVSARSRSRILQILTNLHFPEESEIDYADCYNGIRTIAEGILKRYCEKQILPPQFIANGRVNFAESSHYLSGNPANSVKLRYGKVEEKNRVFTSHIESIVRLVRDLGNIGSHSEIDSITPLSPNSRTKKSKTLLYSTVFGLCEFIEWSAKLFNMVERGEYQVLDAVSIEDKTEESIQEECELSTDIPSHDDTVYVLEHDENNNVHCGKYLLSYNKYKDYPAGTKGNVSSIKRNNKNNKDRYPLFAGKFDIVD